jgi:carbon monoxide dehydrogenase subunit G
VKQQGEYTITSGVQTVWAALNDPKILQASIPGCESLEQVDAENFKASVRAKVGPVNAVFQVALSLADVQAPTNYRLNGEVKGAAGVAKGEAQVELQALPDAHGHPETRLVYEVQASVGGKLAQIGARLIDGAAKKMADEFFAAFSEACMQDYKTETTELPCAETSTVETSEAEKPSEQPAQRASDGIGFIWVTAFVVLILAMVLAL